MQMVRCALGERKGSTKRGERRDKTKRGKRPKGKVPNKARQTRQSLYDPGVSVFAYVQGSHTGAFERERWEMGNQRRGRREEKRLEGDDGG